MTLVDVRAPETAYSSKDNIAAPYPSAALATAAGLRAAEIARTNVGASPSTVAGSSADATKTHAVRRAL